MNPKINDEPLYKVDVKQMLIPKNATNGEVIQKMFPKAEVLHQYQLSYKDINVVTVIIGKQLFNFDLNWWNSKWGE